MSRLTTRHIATTCLDASRRTLSPTPAPRPGPRLRRGRTNARAPVARKPCLGAPVGEGLRLHRADAS
ncbi:hypothetical protein XaplCFBP3122_17825 [Xanthomonas arboricola pv. populi]|uniref:Uncharacterized protein n=1 Tax=Xanthomonas arboricola pv. populi TaxID=487823 RepID=A0A2S6Z0M6_9XANT|nr:hypothetical protein XaplCFBP3122_17825 [Xanthomonas arboricola pv. populi]